jgi:hypothetical protein
VRHEVRQSHQSRTEVKNKWSYTSSPLICLHGVDRDSFTFHGQWNVPGFRGNVKTADGFLPHLFLFIYTRLIFGSDNA